MRRRRLLAGCGIAAASLVVGVAATLGYGLSTGFERAAEQADLPHVVARFSEEPRGTVDARVGALPNLAARSYRYEIRDVPLRARGESTRKGSLHVVLGGRRGYAIVAGRDLRAQGEVVVERGLAREWGLAVGDTLRLGDSFDQRIVGVGLEPTNVAFPLTVTPRVYMLPWEAGFPANLALLWLNDPAREDVVLAQARATSFGVGDLRFVTRAGIEVLLGQAAGIVLALLGAFSVVALLAAGTMLAAGAQADVARRLPAFGVQRALGFTPGRLALRQARDSAAVAVPAAALGLAAGALAVAGPSADLLAQLNEQPPGWALVPVLALCLLAIVALVTAAGTWPAWRAARRPPAEILRGAPMVGGRSPHHRGKGTGPFSLGARFAVAARGRWAAAVATVGVCVGVVTLMLALASLLERLRDDPATLGKRYQLTARLEPSMAGAVAAIPGVEAAAPRYQVEAADSFRLGEPVRLIAFPGDHTEFEAPPLADGRRLRGPGEVEVGAGLADALGLRPGATLAVQLEGAEVRFVVAGVVRALERDGRVAYVRPDRLLASGAGLDSALAIRLAPGADRAAVERRLTEYGAPPVAAAGATTRNAAFLAILAAVLRGVGLAVGLVCLYALVQALAMTARERRGAVALLRAVGGDARTIAAVFAGAALAVALPAAVLGIVLEWLVFGPLVGRLAAGFAALPLAPGPGQVAVVLAGVLLLAAAATALVARRTVYEPIVRGLREE